MPSIFEFFHWSYVLFQGSHKVMIPSVKSFLLSLSQYVNPSSFHCLSTSIIGRYKKRKVLVGTPIKFLSHSKQTKNKENMGLKLKRGLKTQTHSSFSCVFYVALLFWRSKIICSPPFCTSNNTKITQFG